MATIVLSDSSNYVAGVPAVGTNVRADLDAIITQCNTGLDGDNIAPLGVDTASLAASCVTSEKLSTSPAAVLEANIHYGASTGALVARAGPSYDGGGAPRIAVVNKPVTWDGTSTDTVTFTYATDCAHGDPGFTDVPYLLGAPVVATVEGSTDVITSWQVTASTNLLITFVFGYGGGTADVRIQFGVYGQITAP